MPVSGVANAPLQSWDNYSHPAGLSSCWHAYTWSSKAACPEENVFQLPWPEVEQPFEGAASVSLPSSVPGDLDGFDKVSMTGSGASVSRFTMHDEPPGVLWLNEGQLASTATEDQQAGIWVLEIMPLQ
ncbi:hypothetical protein WJX77_008065 [Trebouxia sp. C0004]